VGANADNLRHELRGIAVEQSANGACDSVPSVAVGAIGQETESQAAPRAVHPVNRDCADWIVDLYYFLDEERRLDNENSRNDTDQAGGRGGNESARCSDCDEAREHAVAHHAGIRLAGTYFPHP